MHDEFLYRLYVSHTAAERPLVKEFVEFYLLNAGALAPTTDFVALGPDAYQAALLHFRNAERAAEDRR